MTYFCFVFCVFVCRLLLLGEQSVCRDRVKKSQCTLCPINHSSSEGPKPVGKVRARPDPSWAAQLLSRSHDNTLQPFSPSKSSPALAPYRPACGSSSQLPKRGVRGPKKFSLEWQRQGRSGTPEWPTSGELFRTCGCGSFYLGLWFILNCDRSLPLRPRWLRPGRWLSASVWFC